MFSAVKQFASPEMQIAFLRQHGERVQVVTLLKQQGRLDEAYDEMLISGEAPAAFTAEASCSEPMTALHSNSAPTLQTVPPTASSAAPSTSLAPLPHTSAAAAAPGAPVALMEQARELARAFTLASILKTDLARGLAALPTFLNGSEEPTTRSTERQAEAVAEALNGSAVVGAVAEADGGGGGALLWKDLALFLVLDALNDAFAHSRHGGSADADADESVLEWTLLLVLALRRVLSAEADELRRHTDIFLRLRGSTHPLLRMPSWRWLCARTAHDVKQTLIAGSERLRALVEQAAVATAAAWLERFPPMAIATRLRTRLLSEEHGQVLRGAQVC
jgi:hypothetical protein